MRKLLIYFNKEMIEMKKFYFYNKIIIKKKDIIIKNLIIKNIIIKNIFIKKNYY